MQHFQSIALTALLALANSVCAFPASGVSNFKTPEEACAAWAKGSKGTVTTRDTGDGHVGCSAKDGDNVNSQESVGQANCPLNAHPKTMRSCQCDAGYTYRGNACVDGSTGPAGNNKPPSPGTDDSAKPPEPAPWSRARISAIARKRVIVGMHAIVTVKDGFAALDGLRLPGAFAQVRGDEKQVQAMGNGGFAALLPEVQVRKGYQRSSGYLLRPAQPKSPSIEFVAWNTGEPIKDHNASHAEHQFCEYLAGTGSWLSNVRAIRIDVFGRDVCAQCQADIKRLQQVMRDRGSRAVVEVRRAD